MRSAAKWSRPTWVVPMWTTVANFEVLLNLFPNLHVSEGRRHLRMPESRCQRTQSQRDGGRYQKSGRQVNHIEDQLEQGDDDWVDDEQIEAEAYDQDDDVGAQLAEVMKTGLEETRDELDQWDKMSDDGSVLSSRDQALFEAAAATLAGVSDALEVVRGLKKSIAGGKGRSKGAAPKGSPAVDANPRKAPGKGKDRPQGYEQIKAPKSTCKSCGQKGHWAGDPECPNSSRLRSAHVVDHSLDDDFEGNRS